MSGAPGVTLVERDSPVAGSLPLDTGTAYFAGLCERGAVDKVLGPFRNLAQVIAATGGRVAYGYLYDAADIFFKEGGSLLYLAREVGPAPKTSTLKLSDGDDDTLEVSATSPGAWGDDIEVGVTVPGGGTFTLPVSYLDEVVEELGPYATNAEAVQGVEEESAYIRLKDLGGGDPEAAEATALTGGDDDRANITDTQRKAALALFTADLGPGQVARPGATTTGVHAMLLEHAEANHRTALLDGADTATVGTLTAAAATSRALDAAGCGGLFAPWAIVAGVTAGTTRTVPYSVIQAGLIARLDSETYNSTHGVNNPNEPAAGVNGISRTALGLSQEAWTDVERGTLNDAGVNVARVLFGQVRTYGYRTLANPLTKPLQALLNNRRIDMAILAKADVITERFNFGQVDGRGRKLANYAGVLRTDVLLPYYEVDALFGDTDEEAYTVDTSDQVNPVEELAKGNVRALIEAARAPFAEKMTLEYAKKELA